MATGSVYPASLDVFTNKVDGIDDILSDETNTQSSAIEQLEAKVGVNNSSVVTSHEYKINNVILTDPTTTRGDFLVRDASSLSRLAVGSNKQILGSDGVDPVWTNEHEVSKHLRPYTYGETITAGDCLYLKTSDGKVYKALATATSTMYPFIGFAAESGVLDDVKMVTYDWYLAGSPTYTAGTIYYMSDSVAGAITSTPPTLAKRVGIGITTQILAINREVGQMSFKESNCTIQKYYNGADAATPNTGALLIATTNWTRLIGERFIRVSMSIGLGVNTFTNATLTNCRANGEIRVNTVAKAKGVVGGGFYQNSAADIHTSQSGGNVVEAKLDLDALSIPVGNTVTVDFYIWVTTNFNNVAMAYGTGKAVHVNAITAIQ